MNGYISHSGLAIVVLEKTTYIEIFSVITESNDISLK